MSLLADLAAVPKARRGRPCEFSQYLASLNDEEAAAVRAAIGTMPDAQVAFVITKNGYQVSPSTIANHRGGKCMTCRS